MSAKVPPKHSEHGNYRRADYFEAQCERLTKALLVITEVPISGAGAHTMAVLAQRALDGQCIMCGGSKIVREGTSPGPWHEMPCPYCTSPS